MMKTTSQVLQEARQLIEQGWCQDALRIADPVTGEWSYCVMGALRVTANRSELCAVVLLLADHLPLGGKDNDHPDLAILRLVDFNNAYDRTQEEVLALFD